MILIKLLINAGIDNRFSFSVAIEINNFDFILIIAVSIFIDDKINFDAVGLGSVFLNIFKELDLNIDGIIFRDIEIFKNEGLFIRLDAVE